jgi:hypothetical protein
MKNIITHFLKIKKFRFTLTSAFTWITSTCRRPVEWNVTGISHLLSSGSALVWEPIDRPAFQPARPAENNESDVTSVYWHQRKAMLRHTTCSHRAYVRGRVKDLQLKCDTMLTCNRSNHWLSDKAFLVRRNVRAWKGGVGIQLGAAVYYNIPHYNIPHYNIQRRQQFITKGT